MSMVLKVSLIIFIVLVILALALRVLKSVLKVGRLKTQEYEIPQNSYFVWEAVLAHPGKINLETLCTGEVPGSVYDLNNLEGKESLGIKEEKLRPPLLAHWINHETKGHFLVDTGFDSAFVDKPWGRFEGMIKKVFFQFKVKKDQAIDEVLRKRHLKIDGVFCTHFHEHQGGAPSFPDDTPFIFGKGEKEIAAFPLAYSRFLTAKTDLRTIDFETAADMPIVGKAVDLFGDGSFWAISTPGHTPGHISYLVNGMKGQYLLMGDICMCRMGWELGVESGKKYSENPALNRISFFKIKEFLDTYPQIKPVFGHESEHFPIRYQKQTLRE